MSIEQMINKSNRLLELADKDGDVYIRKIILYSQEYTIAMSEYHRNKRNIDFTAHKFWAYEDVFEDMVGIDTAEELIEYIFNNQTGDEL
jgi:hypothetical protein